MIKLFIAAFIFTGCYTTTEVQRADACWEPRNYIMYIPIRPVYGPVHGPIYGPSPNKPETKDAVRKIGSTRKKSH